jgi:hypothetical protein
MICKRVIRALHTTERESHNHNLFDFGTQLRFDAATVTKIKISPGTRIMLCRAHRLMTTMLTQGRYCISQPKTGIKLTSLLCVNSVIHGLPIGQAEISCFRQYAEISGEVPPLASSRRRFRGRFTLLGNHPVKGSENAEFCQ